MSPELRMLALPELLLALSPLGDIFIGDFIPVSSSLLFFRGRMYPALRSSEAQLNQAIAFSSHDYSHALSLYPTGYF